MPTTLISTWIDGYESDPALAVTATFEAPAHGPSPIITLVGPDGQVELIGELTIRAFIAQAERQLGFMARKASREAAAA